MKNLVLVYIMGLMGLVMFVSCDKGSEYDETALIKAKQPETKPDKPTPEPKDTTETKDWDVASKKSLKPVGEPSANSHKWEGTMVFYCGKDSLVKKADQTVEFSLATATGFSSAKTNEAAQYTGPSSISSNSQNTSYGEWYDDAQGNNLRKVTMTVEVKTSEFAKTLVMSRRDAYCVVNGRENAFLYHTMSASFKSLDVVKTEEIERNDSIFEQKTYCLTFNCKFAVSSMNVKTYEVSSTHTVEAFLRLKEKSEEQMPSADLYVGKLINATDVVAAPRIVGTGSNVKVTQWHKTSLVIEEDIIHIWVDGKFVRTVKKSDYNGSNFNAAMLHEGEWVPCLCTADGQGGYNYAVEFADGSYHVDPVAENLCVVSGLKNLTKDNRADQSPFIKTVRESKKYNGKVWLKITCYNVDGKTTLSYTVAEK